MRFLIEDLTSQEITTLPNFCSQKFNLFDLSNYLVNSICKLTLEKNSLDKIIEIHPVVGRHELEEALIEIEMSYDEDAFKSSTIQDIATPDCKLYYPEPFIASPSFVHEEI
jgi:hypothetical protein